MQIQYITQDHPALSHAEQARRAYTNGIGWVQLRMKNASDSDMLVQAREALAYAREANGVLLINDRVDICQAVDAHGVHVGLTDMSVAEARNVLGAEKIIGATANTIEHIALHAAQGADYIGLGPLRYTTTKQNLSPIIGFAGYETIVAEMKRRKLQILVVAVGGITLADLPELHRLGLGAAISGALLRCLLENESIFPVSN
ncbi:MAG: thiamine phosphate synthase [Prevotellaceae bacterium]|jgi:thiamine-phosphate pyrophosphorylase|nr:thiamine phosphate synthase [Prevotellaceae bacterium]